MGVIRECQVNLRESQENQAACQGQLHGQSDSLVAALATIVELDERLFDLMKRLEKVDCC